MFEGVGKVQVLEGAFLEGLLYTHGNVLKLGYTI